MRTVLSVLAAQMQESQQTPAVWSQGTAESRPQVMTLQRGPSHSSRLHTTQELGAGRVAGSWLSLRVTGSHYRQHFSVCFHFRFWKPSSNAWGFVFTSFSLFNHAQQVHTKWQVCDGVPERQQQQDYTRGGGEVRSRRENLS